MDKGRTKWIDVAKGIAIILVVLTHILIVGKVPIYIYSFHMPIFFFLSGYLFTRARYETLGLIKQKARTILLPYFAFSFITYAYWLLIERRFSGNGLDPLQAFINIFLSQGTDKYLPYNPALWFLPCLFLVVVAFHLIDKYTLEKRLLIFSMLGCAFIGYYAAMSLPNNIYWNLDVIPVALVFYGVGYLCQYNRRFVQLTADDHDKGWFWTLVGLFIMVGFGYKIALSNGQVGMSSNHYGNYLLFFTAAFLGIGAVVTVASKFYGAKILSYLGKNSLIIFGLHFPVKRVVMDLTATLLHIRMDAIRASFWLSIVDTVIVLIIMVPIIYVINRYLPFLIGKKKLSEERRAIVSLNKAGQTDAA